MQKTPASESLPFAPSKKAGNTAAVLPSYPLFCQNGALLLSVLCIHSDNTQAQAYPPCRYRPAKYICVPAQSKYGGNQFQVPLPSAWHSFPWHTSSEKTNRSALHRKPYAHTGHIPRQKRSAGPLFFVPGGQPAHPVPLPCLQKQRPPNRPNGTERIAAGDIPADRVSHKAQKHNGSPPFLPFSGICAAHIEAAARSICSEPCPLFFRSEEHTSELQSQR